jgi:hypothetical protein
MKLDTLVRVVFAATKEVLMRLGKADTSKRPIHIVLVSPVGGSSYVLPAFFDNDERVPCRAVGRVKQILGGFLVTGSISKRPTLLRTCQRLTARPGAIPLY